MLRVTLIDVGWGDSILLESVNANGDQQYALIDSNDTATLRSSHIFLKRFFQRKNFVIPAADPVFEWVLLTHAHADHGQGLKRILKDYRTRRFWYPKSNSGAVFFTDLVRYARRSTRGVAHHQAIDTTKNLPVFGDVSMEVLWPPHNTIDQNENNNSVVLALKLVDVCFVLTGDAEADVWTQISSRIPTNTQFFKVPHHGSDNAMFTSATRQTPWLDELAGGGGLCWPSAVMYVLFHTPAAPLLTSLTTEAATTTGLTSTITSRSKPTATMFRSNTATFERRKADCR